MIICTHNLFTAETYTLLVATAVTIQLKGLPFVRYMMILMEVTIGTKCQNQEKSNQNPN